MASYWGQTDSPVLCAQADNQECVTPDVCANIS